MNFSTKVYCFIILLIIVAFSTPIYSKDNKSSKDIKKYKATIVDNSGSTTELTNFCRIIVSHNAGSKVYTDEPTVVETATNWIGLGAIEPGMPGFMMVPFEIIKNIKFEKREADDWNINPFLLATVTLGDGMVMTGSSGGYFEGESGLGKAAFDINIWDFKKGGARQINFEHDIIKSRLL